MNQWTIFCILVAALSLLFGGGYGLWQQRQSRKTVGKINQMLDLAINGDFTETTFDETELSALEAKLNRYLSQSAVSAKNLTAEKDKVETMISDISHQTKTPIANILLYSQLLGEGNLPPECQASIKALSSQAKKLNFLIGALVKTSRLETGIIRVSPERNSVGQMLFAVGEEIRTKAAEKEITVTVEDTDAVAVFDSKWTVEALYNIVDNAVKYTQPGGSVIVSAVSYELFCRIDVQDSGMGIKEAEQSKIFARFYRSPQVSEEEGVGIGLFLTREILSAQDGYIKVASKEGKGSVFSVFLPICR